MNPSDAIYNEENQEDTELSCDDEYSDESDTEIINEFEEINEEVQFNEGDPTAFYIATLEEQLILTQSRDKVNEGIQSLLNWLMYSTDDLGITAIISSNPVLIWTFLQTKDEWNALSDFALRCFSLVASEAGVERVFSQHKYVIGHLRRRSSKELRIARLDMKI